MDPLPLRAWLTAFTLPLSQADMGVTRDPRDELHTVREHWTTIVLEERDDDTWIATQTGVDIEGAGDTAAAAATDYCRKVDDAAR